MSFISNALKGAAMGMAEVIPGVSGGTIAFITGIYERLLAVIKSFSPSLIKTFKADGLKGVYNAVDGTFIISLVVGMIGGLVVGLFGIEYFLEHYPPVVWAFFFGLIIASAIYVAKQITKWTAKEFILLIVCAITLFFITQFAPTEGSSNLLFVFLSGAIAISAFILPGISGSFILILLGMYQIVVLDNLKGLMSDFSTDKLILVGTFMLGCLFGLLTFSRVLSWAFKHHKNITLAGLTGIMIGSLNKIFPWHNTTKWLDKGDGELKPLVQENVLPGNYEGEPYVLAVVAFMIIGFASVFIIEALSKKK